MYGLEDHISSNLCLSYYTHSKNGKHTKSIRRIKENETNEFVLKGRTYIDQRGNEKKLTLEDLTLHVVTDAGSEYEKDITCDSEFMMNSIDEIGIAIRDSFHWVPRDVPIYLYMDNAGGHGTDDIKKEYVSILKRSYNIIVEWQIANSPETNLLDLGCWVTMQSMVEKMHKFKCMESNVLARSVRSTFIAFDLQSIQKVWDRWKIVLDLIICGKGTNDLVELHRGKLTSSLDYLPVTIDVCDMSVLLDCVGVDDVKEAMTNDINVTVM